MPRVHHLLFLTLALPAALPAQGQVNLKSQLGTVSQVMASTRVDIIYRRPTARGRTLFGALVPWGQIWSPSADTAARVTFSTAVEINGTPLAAGTYGIWAIPDSLEWTMVFTRAAVAFHMRYPQGQDAVRLKIAPTHAEHVETLEFAFPSVDGDSAVMVLRWGTTVVPMRIRTQH